ncbi:protoporphyrinogen oxidase [Chondromyces apiculatus]|uniref:Protoporphyrinogen IX oxidase, aerobic, HemY n=1 Tax=Chondromyces apiculatus DSM 436 TaxID=1192034 RepID=A0A017T198_9BACT|nr:protoporphyrinogen oxidase [Chondromyces apiculatus]EYF02341.1 Protoporphyrinogen IX oxidase, aerobic, HemY [Chondromyces apiculatus DSM 436]
MTVRKVVIAGGGITGLTVAYRLLAAARSGESPAVEVTLLEARPTLGGNIRTERTGGFVLDGGPDAWVVAKPHASDLCRELGLGDRLVDTVGRNRRVYLPRQGKLHAMPEGLVLTVPTRVLPFAGTPLLSWSAKARMGMDLLLPRRRAEEDESIGSFIRRRLGEEAVEQLAEPLLGGIYAGDVESLSIRSTFPQLAAMEKKHGSMILGALALRRARESGPERGSASAFHSLLGGVGELVDVLARRVERAGGRILTGSRIEAITRAAGVHGAGPGATPELSAEDPGPRYLVRVGGRAEPVPADEVVVALPAYAAADAVSGLDLDIAAALRLMPYESTATVLLGYRRSDVPHPLDAVGAIIPRPEGRRALALTFASSKWPGRAPDDAALLRVFLGGHRDPHVLANSDEELIALACEELRTLLGVTARPLLSRTFRFDRASAQPLVGHTERLGVLRRHVARHPGLHFAGAAFDGIGIPDCIRQATEVARAILSGGPRSPEKRENGIPQPRT